MEPAVEAECSEEVKIQALSVLSASMQVLSVRPDAPSNLKVASCSQVDGGGNRTSKEGSQPN